MTPGFALSLSVDGIMLLARAAGGWRVAGRATLDAEDLAGALSDLRARAVELDDASFRTKLIIPNDQIRYLSVDTGHVATADRIEQVRQALDGATPYPVEDLVYDICVDGPMTHVAAVARETLEEAEAFALEHRFNPVSFVAMPGDAAFLGEPFFGPTSFSDKALTSGERVEADGVAVVIIGDIEDAPEEDAPDEGKTQGEIEEPPALSPTAEPPLPPAEPPMFSAASRADDRDAPAPDTGQPATPGFSSRRKSQMPEPVDASPSTISPRIVDDEAEPDPSALAASLAGPDIPDDPDSATADSGQKWAARFLSRRSNTDEPSEQRPAPASPAPRTPPRRLATQAAAANNLTMDDGADERTRMTIFGMRDKDEVTQEKAPPRHLGLVLTAILLIFLAGVAAWAAVFMDEEIASLFGRQDPVEQTPLPAVSLPVPEPVEEQAAPTEIATRDPDVLDLSDTDAAVLDALRPEPGTDQSVEEAPRTSAEDAEAHYAVTGIWQTAPETPDEPGLIGLDDLYITSIDTAVDARDAIALPAPDLFETDQALGQISSPAAPDARFAFDDRGRVIPTPEGALSPDGFTVVLGPPPVVPPPTPPRSEAPQQIAAAAPSLPDLRPRLRPADLVEQSERSQLGGLTRSELSGVRPLLRPEVAKREDEADETPTEQAVVASMSPRLRPVNMAQLVTAARNARQRSAESQVAAAATASVATRTVAATTVAPRIPSAASVSRAATQNNAINLRRVNLIGVYGTPANRRALVRLPNGRYRKVEVGDRLDGGRISAIGESELRYQKSGRNVVLRIPSG